MIGRNEAPAFLSTVHDAMQHALRARMLHGVVHRREEGWGLVSADHPLVRPGPGGKDARKAAELVDQSCGPVGRLLGGDRCEKLDQELSAPCVVSLRRCWCVP